VSIRLILRLRTAGGEGWEEAMTAPAISHGGWTRPGTWRPVAPHDRAARPRGRSTGEGTADRRAGPRLTLPGSPAGVPTKPGNGTPMTDLVFGLDTFGDVPRDGSGNLVSYAAAIQQVVEEAVLADKLGVDAIALGEHASAPRPDRRSARRADSARRGACGLGRGPECPGGDLPRRRRSGGRSRRCGRRDRG
jgi:hypothetical protein